MRRSASEILRNLESRVARLERRAKSPWDNMVARMKSYFERKVGNEFKDAYFELDVRTPSDSRKLSSQYENTATLVFILNGEGVYVDAYEHEEKGRKYIGYNLMAQDGRKVLYNSNKNLTPGAKDVPPKIIEELKQFVTSPVDHTEVLNDLYRELQDDYINANNVSDLLQQLFSGKDLKDAFRYAKGTQGSNPYAGAKALWEDFVVVKMRDQIREARIPTTL
jgi:hypothetical protein